MRSEASVVVFDPGGHTLPRCHRGKKTQRHHQDDVHSKRGQKETNIHFKDTTIKIYHYKDKGAGDVGFVTRKTQPAEPKLMTRLRRVISGTVMVFYSVLVCKRPNICSMETTMETYQYNDRGAGDVGFKTIRKAIRVQEPEEPKLKERLRRVISGIAMVLYSAFAVYARFISYYLTSFEQEDEDKNKGDEVFQIRMVALILGVNYMPRPFKLPYKTANNGRCCLRYIEGEFTIVSWYREGSKKGKLNLRKLACVKYGPWYFVSFF